MSRITSIITLLFFASSTLSANQGHADALATYHAFTSVEPHCGKPATGDEIVICGNRRADQWRVPFVGYERGDPNGESVSSERNRLASEPCFTVASVP